MEANREFHEVPGSPASIAFEEIGFPDKVPMGAAMNKGLTFKLGQTHVQRRPVSG
jgi:hypothetical protein